jgi:Zn-finger nucleic acid-binding protein
MNCPACKSDLTVAYRDDVETAYCPKCDVNWIGDDDFEINLEDGEFANAESDLVDGPEPGRWRAAVNRNGSI